MSKILSEVWIWLKNCNWTDIATIASLAFVAMQTRTLKKTYQYTCDWQGKEKAAKLAVEYKEKILPSIAYIGAVLKSTGIMSVLRDIHASNIKQFTQTELFRLTNDKIEEEVDAKRNDLDSISSLLRYRGRFTQIYHKGLHNINPALIEKWYAAQKDPQKTDAQATITDEEKRVLLNALWYEYDSVVSDTLNNLEYFAMNFVSKVADSAVVFQSLHQTYLSLVQMLYYNIAVQNVYEKDKYYTNVVSLYAEWYDKDIRNEKAISDAIPKSVPVRK